MFRISIMINGTGIYVKEIEVTDPDSNAEVRLAVFKHSNGGMFAIDSSFIVECTEVDDDNPKIQDPFEKQGEIILFGT